MFAIAVNYHLLMCKLIKKKNTVLNFQGQTIKYATIRQTLTKRHQVLIYAQIQNRRLDYLWDTPGVS